MAKTGKLNEDLIKEDEITDQKMTMAMRKDSITEQISQGKKFLTRRYKAKRYILYLQSYSNTFAPLGELQEVYDHAISQADFTEFVIATRPDCINEQNARLIASYRERISGDLWVELGLQSGNDRTLDLINRGHTVETCSRAVDILRSHGIKITLHVIFGLPGDGYEELGNTLEIIRQIHPEAVKIHNLHIPIRTRMYHQYLLGEISAPGVRRHLSYTIWFLERIPEDIIVQRVVCDTPAHRLAAPARFGAKGSFVQLLSNEMRRRETWQGRLFKTGEGHAQTT